MTATVDALGSSFAALDLARRGQGLLLDAVGLGPEQSRAHLVASRPGLRLSSYGGDGVPVLLVPAPIKRHYIWDLEPAVSVVRRCLAGGHAVYLCEWRDHVAAAYGLRDSVLDLVALSGAIARLARRPPIVIGHSLGGTLATIAAAQQPDAVAALAVIEAPLCFGPGAGRLARLAAASPPAEAVLPSRAGLPGSFLSLVAAMASPEVFQIGRLADLVLSSGDPERLRRHLRVERWVLDEWPMPRRLFGDVLEMLYRADAFHRGTLNLGDGMLGPTRVKAPLLAIIDPASPIVPPDAVLPFQRAAASREKMVLAVRPEPGTGFPHLTALIGPRCHQTLWPRALAWLAAAAMRRQ